MTSSLSGVSHVEVARRSGDPVDRQGVGVDDEVADPVVPKGIQYVKEVLTEDLLVGHHYSLSTDDRTQCQGQLPRSFGAGGRHAV